MHYDAILLVSFGGPERVADVIPFLENVLRGRNVPRERMLHVAENHYHFGGRSPTLSIGGFVAAMAISLGGALLLGLLFALLGPFLVR
jgi:protoheme ferro-lyase